MLGLRNRKKAVGLEYSEPGRETADKVAGRCQIMEGLLGRGKKLGLFCVMEATGEFVLKCRFYYYFRLVRPQSRRQLPMKRQFVIFRDPKRRGKACSRLQGEAAGWSGGRESKGETRPESLLWFLWEDGMRQGKQA